MKKYTIFIDRDGTIIESPSHEPSYNFRSEHLHFIPNSIKAIKKLNDKNTNVIIITNQAGINEGLYTHQDYNNFTSLMISELQNNGASIDRIYYCPHKKSEQCKCRKPNTKMFEDAKKDMDIDLSNSYMIGDALSDMEAGRSAGCKTIMVMSGLGKRDYNIYSSIIKNKNLVDFTAHDLFDALEFIDLK